jgi:hypothetical protein
MILQKKVNKSHLSSEIFAKTNLINFRSVLIQENPLGLVIDNYIKNHYNISSINKEPDSSLRKKIKLIYEIKNKSKRIESFKKIYSFVSYTKIVLLSKNK